MKEICFVSSNESKINEVTKHLEKFDIKVTGKYFEVPEIDYYNQETISRAKATAACKEFNEPLIVEDTGIYFSAYKNFPGVRTRFVIRGIGYEGIFRLLAGKDRRAEFVTIVSYCSPDSSPISFTGKCRGTITEEVRGKTEEKLPYDAIFIPDGAKRTFVEMTKEEKAKY